MGGSKDAFPANQADHPRNVKDGTTQLHQGSPSGTIRSDVLADQSDAIQRTLQRNYLDQLSSAYQSLNNALPAIDNALPSTSAYQTMCRVRDNALEHFRLELKVTVAMLDSPHPWNAEDVRREIHDNLERGALTLYLIPIFAMLAALLRAAETDRLITNVIVLLSAEAQRYADVLAIVAAPRNRALPRIRLECPIWFANTKKMIGSLREALRKGRNAVSVLEKVEAVLDIAFEFAAGVLLPPLVLLQNFAVDKAGFVLAHQKEFEALVRSVPSFLRELNWLDNNAPLTRKFVLLPILLAVGKEALSSVSAADIAFIIGRTLMNIKSAGGLITWKKAVWALLKATAIVLILDSPKLLLRGIDSLSHRTAESVLRNVGGEKDPYGIIAELNSKLEQKLSPIEAAALLAELTGKEVEGHLNLKSEVEACASSFLGI
jgi:hypothetical protein